VIYDVIVVGLGPGGSVAARMLAEHGMRVIAFDKECMPRYKPCGGALSARVLRELDVDLATVIQATIYGGAFTFRGADQFSAHFHEPVVYMVMRPQFDQLLSQCARRKGALIHEGERVHTIRQRDTDVEVTTSRGIYRAAWLIGADGARGTVRHSVTQESRVVPISGLEAEVTATQHVIQHYTHQVALDFGEVPNGYSWIFPKSDHLSVGTAGALRQVAHPRDFLRRFLTSNGLSTSTNEKIYGHVIPTFLGGRLHVQRQRILLIGDAAQLVDPFLGEGIYYAVKSARIASHTLLDCAPQSHTAGQQYEKRLHGLLDELRIALKIARLVYRFPYYGYHLFKTHHTLAQGYFKVLRGESSFAQFYRLLRHKAITNVVPYRLRRRSLEYHNVAVRP
jgi:geranylgeranyl reductase family protein